MTAPIWLEVFMIKHLLLMFLLLGQTQHAFGTAMLPELSRCKELQEISEKHILWKIDFQKFKMDNSLSLNEKFEVSRDAFRGVLLRIQRIQQLSGLSADSQSLIDDSTQVYTKMILMLGKLKNSGSLPADADSFLLSTNVNIAAVKMAIDNELTMALEKNSCDKVSQPPVSSRHRHTKRGNAGR